jgi:excinuclease ABC subunit C
MIDRTDAREFDGFGPFTLGPGKEPRVTELLLPGDDRTTRRLLRRYCPGRPGVYGMVDAADELIYVGKSKSLCDRLLSYFGAAARGEKGGRIVDHTVRLLWEPSPHEFVALVRELELIRGWQPRFNVRGRSERFRRSYVCLGRGPAPQVRLAYRPAAGDSILFGPLAATRGSRHAVALVNNCFGLRDCSPRVAVAFADQLELFPQPRGALCMRHEMGDCLGPCAAACTWAEYEDRVRQARDFLAGRDRTILRRLEASMREAAGRHQFERAAALRDQWTAMAELDSRLRRLRHVCRDYRFVYPLPGYGRRQLWYLVDRGQVAGCVGAPHNAATADRCLRLLDAVFPPGRSPQVTEMPEDLDATMLVLLWFRKHPEELNRTLTPATARVAAVEARRAVA